MILPEGVHQLKAFAQFPGKACRIVPVDGQSAAFFRTVEGKGPDDDMAAGPDRLSQTRHVGGAVRWIDQEMKGGPVMPDVEAVGRLPIGDVGGDPFHFARAVAESRPGGVKRGLRNVQHRHALEPARQKAVDQA